MTVNINYGLLAKKHNMKEVDLSYTGCQYPLAIKAKRE